LANKIDIETWKIPLYKIYTDEEDLNIIAKVIRRGSFWAIGPEIEEFEKLIKNYVGTNYCLAVNSGTSALHASLLAFDISVGNEVIVPSFTFISTANSILFVDAKPVFGDIEENTLGLDPEDIVKKITPNTKAILPVDYAGLSCNIPLIKKIAKDNDLIIIEDVAESLGSSINGNRNGSFADVSVFSFASNKIITTGEGGAIVTNSKDVYEKIKLIRSHGRIDDLSYFDSIEDPQYVQLGFNWRMSSITAALGITQLNKLDKIIKLRKENANYLSSRLSRLSQVKVPNEPEGYDHVYQFYSIRLPNKKTRDDLHTYLKNKRIMSKVYFKPIHLMPFYKKRFHTGMGLLPVTEKISEQILTLPMYPNMTIEEKKYLIDTITEFFE